MRLWKENLSEINFRSKYLGNIWFQDFIDAFAKWQKFQPFLVCRKNFKLLEYGHVTYYFKAPDLGISNILFVSRNI